MSGAWLAWSLALAPLAPVPAGAAPGQRAVEVPRQDSPAAQLRHAGELRTALRGLRGEPRRRAEADAVAAYRAVRRHWPAAGEACAEAAFRAGEILRAAGELEPARAEFELARAVRAPTPFRARAALEIGHLHRRAHRAVEALDAYLAVAQDPRTDAQRKDEATLWAGRAYADLGKHDEARRRWIAVAEHAEDPLQRVEAWDELALALVDAGDLEGAAGWLARARTTLADAALEETEQGERVRSALERMRAIRRLERAVRERSERAAPPKNA